ncbi:MAG: flagellar biosynthesis protein FlhA [Zetaproteobacteria bacterium]|nr:flagellar biosynthesis protein FlhA [Zetaproteobacteria bacterium]
MLIRARGALLAIGVLVVVMLMIIPMPAALVDILLAMNITVSVLILLIAVYLLRPLDFSVFPSLLLLTTLFRLALNVATTRLILLHGNEGPEAAGDVIRAFGQFVVGGNFVVGLVIFLILVMINFMVITKGSTRIAEVAARFTLDSMPGKQMAIDADLNAGIIDEKVARARREDVARNADFYGAMDGASKFVRGDAVAGLIMTFINLIGGLIIGVLQGGMAVGDAAATYSILTVGDGLISQIPALMISVAAGIIVTRAASNVTLTVEVTRQFTAYPQVFIVASGALGLLSLVPGLPFIPFMLMSVGTGLIGWFLLNPNEGETLENVEEEPEEVEIPKHQVAAPTLPEMLKIDPIRVELGYGLLDIVEHSESGGLIERFQSIRRQVAQDIGFMVPPIHIKDNLQLGVGEYRVMMRGAEVARSDVQPKLFLAIGEGSFGGAIQGTPTQDPAFGLPAVWIHENKKHEAELKGYTVVDMPTVIATHVQELIRLYGHEILDRTQVRAMLDALSERHPKVIEELMPSAVSASMLHRVLQSLLKEWVPIRDLLMIIETLADLEPAAKGNLMQMTEAVRERLKRSIIQPYVNEAGELEVLTLSPDVERQMLERLSEDINSPLLLDIARWQRLISNMAEVIRVNGIETPVLLTAPFLRPFLAERFAQSLGRIAVLSVPEVSGNTQIRNIATIGFS